MTTAAPDPRRLALASGRGWAILCASVGQGFQSRSVTFVERGVLGLAVVGAAQAAVLAGIVALVFQGGRASEILLEVAGLVCLFLAALFGNLWQGSIERTTVRANRQGLWVGGAFLPSASLDGAHTFLRAQNVFVRVRRRGLHLPLDIGVRDVAEGERLLRALDLDGAARNDPVIGADGILLRSAGRQRYLRHGAIERVFVIPGAERVEIVLRSGERIALPCRAGRSSELARQIEHALTAAGDGAEADVPRLLRGDRPLRGWIADLRALGMGANAAHRVAPVSADRLWRIVESPATRPTVRAAAAVALGPRLDARDRDRLRAAASATIAPRLRIALEAAAGSARDAELEALLAEVEGEDPGSERRHAPLR
jgi:hypothetical protein